MSYRRRKSWHMHALTPASLEQIPKKLAHLIFKSDSFFREFFFQQRINLHATCCEERNFFNGSSLRASLVLQQRSKPHFYLHLRARIVYSVDVDLLHIFTSHKHRCVRARALACTRRCVPTTTCNSQIKTLRMWVYVVFARCQLSPMLQRDKHEIICSLILGQTFSSSSRSHSKLKWSTLN